MSAMAGKAKVTPETSALLMTDDEVMTAMKRPRDKPGTLYIHEEEEDDAEMYERLTRRRTTSLLVLDSIVVVVEILQFLAVIQSMALRWAWPETFLTATNFVCLFGLDVWDFLKLHTPGVYKHIQSHDVPSSHIPASYFNLVLGWAVCLAVLIVVYIAVYARLRHRKHPFMMVRIARLQHVYVTLVQLIILPVGVVVGRIFHCSDLGDVTIDNTISCSSTEHWALMAAAIVFFVFAFLPFPLWLVYKTRQEVYVMWMSRKKHEALMQLKELEYRQGLNLLWVLKGYHIFASFTCWSIHFRALMHFCKLGLVLIFSLAHRDIWLQAGLTLALFSTMSLLFCVLRPFRVTALNALLVFSYLCLLGLSLYGTVMASASPTLVGSPWMLYPYNVWLLGFLSGLLALGILVFIIYAVTREVICYKRCCKEHLWPTLTKHGLSRLSPHTRKYMRALLRGQIFLENIQKVPPMFARADLLANQIEVINMYCREAEYLRDVTHRPLLNLLDAMIQTHEYIMPKSLFAITIKSSIQETATDFMELLPVFTRRLTQREYDFILVTPVKRRMLLKMFCIAVFLNGRKEKVSRKRLTGEAQARLWEERPVIRDFQEPDYYYEDLYPAPQEELAFRPESALSEDELSDAGLKGHDPFAGGILELRYTSSDDQPGGSGDQVPVGEEELPAYSLIDFRQSEIHVNETPSQERPMSATHHPRSHGEVNDGFVEDDSRADY